MKDGDVLLEAVHARFGNLAKHVDATVLHLLQAAAQCNLWYDDRIVALERYILAEVGFLHELSQIDGQGLVPPNDVCSGEVGVLTVPPASVKRLQERCPRLDWIYPRLLTLPTKWTRKLLIS